MALGVFHCGAQNFDAIGGTADIDWPPAPIASEAYVESRGGISPPRAPRTVREPLEFIRLPMFGRCHDIAANEQTELDLHDEAMQTNPVPLWSGDATACTSGAPSG